MHGSSVSFRRNFGATEDGPEGNRLSATHLCNVSLSIDSILGPGQEKEKPPERLVAEEKLVWHMRQGNANSYQCSYPIRRKGREMWKDIGLDFNKMLPL